MAESTFQMKTLQDYEVISVIGSGSFGTCFKVRDKASGEIYAWKGMDYDELSETKKESLISEINVLRQLKHPNIVQYYHHIVNHETQSIFIVMECCEGGDLSQLIGKCRKERLRFEEKYIWRILYQICKALQVCHNKIKEGTILHRDIKPANVFLDTDGNAKLGDFGLARVLRKNESFAETFVGTPYYMSPELVKGSKYDRKSDVWAVGCLIYEMCSLRPPFKGQQFEQLSKNISGGKFNCIPSCYSSDMQEIISYMLEVKDDTRPSIEIVTRHPVLIRNIVDIPNEFPKLISIEEPENDSKWKLTFTPRIDFSSTALTHLTVDEEVDKHVTGVSTPMLRSELFNSNKRRGIPRTLNCSDPELYESIRQIEDEGDPTLKPSKTGYSPTVITQTIFEKTLQNRLHAIRAHESLLKHREANLLVREQLLNERERRIQELERSLEAKQAALDLMPKNQHITNPDRIPLPPRRSISTRNIAPVVDCNDTYCSIEPNETIMAPTVAKLNIAAMPPPKSLARKVTFKSPKKFTKYDIENIPPPASINSGGRDSKCTLRSSVSSKTSEESDGGYNHKRKSILSIFGLSKTNKNNKPSTNQQSESKIAPEVLDKCQPEELSSIWTSENKRAAFDMLAAMNAAAENFDAHKNNRKYRQSVRERGAASLRRSQHIRRSVIGLSDGLTKVPDQGTRIIV